MTALKSWDWDEPEKVIRAFYQNYEHQTCIFTSVDRDDLKDMGSIIWAENRESHSPDESKYYFRNVNSRFSR